jgi:hypothetical protein
VSAADDLIERAKVLFTNNGDLVECERLCKEALRLSPSDATAMYLAGHAMKKAGNHGEAIQWFKRYLDTHSPVGPLMSLAESYWMSGDIEAAARTFSQVEAWSRHGSQSTPDMFVDLSVQLRAQADRDLTTVDVAPMREFILNGCRGNDRRIFLGHCYFARFSPSKWNEWLYEQLLVPAIERAMAEGDYLIARRLQLDAMMTVGLVPHTSTQWRWCFDQLNPIFSAAGEAINRRLPALRLSSPGHAATRIVFLIDRAIAAGSGHDMLVNILADLVQYRPGQLEIEVYTLAAAPASLRAACGRLGIGLLDFDEVRGKQFDQDDLAERLIAVRETASARAVTAVVLSSTFEGEVCFAASIGLAPVQIYLTMGFHSIECAKLDAYFACASMAKGQKRIEGRPWRTLPLPFSNPFPPEGSAEWLALHGKAQEIRAELLKRCTTIVGTMARPEKLDDEFVAALAAILKENPAALYLWFGQSELPAVQALLRKHDIADRCLFMGWVDTKVFAFVLDVHLDCFGLPTGLTMAETLSVGGAYVLRSGAESRNIGLTAALESVLDGNAEIDASTLSEAKAIFGIGSGGEHDLALAYTTEQYVALAGRLIREPEFRQRAGSAAKRFMVQYYHAGGRFADAFLGHLDDLLSAAS